MEYIKTIPVNQLIPIDLIVFENLLTKKQFQVVQLNPALCVQESLYYTKNAKLISNLEEERSKLNKNNLNKRTPPVFSNLNRILTAPYRHFMKLYRRIVEFR